jgi:hypothetical protein
LIMGNLLVIPAIGGLLSGTSANDIFVIRPPQASVGSFYTGFPRIQNFQPGDKIGIVKGEIPLNEIAFNYEDLGGFYGGRPTLLLTHAPTSTVLATFSFDSSPVISDVVELEPSTVVSYAPISTFNIFWGSGLNPGSFIGNSLVPPIASPNDQIIGTEKDDAIYGFNGSDRLLGLDGKDVVVGGDGNDRIAGGDGDDILYGGDGRNIVKGGAGADVFVLNDFGFQDIPDYEIGKDQIALPPGISLSQIEIRISFAPGSDRRFTEIYRVGYANPLANVRSLGVGVPLTATDLITTSLDLSQPGSLLQPGAPNVILPPGNL